MRPFTGSICLSPCGWPDECAACGSVGLVLCGLAAAGFDEGAVLVGAALGFACPACGSEVAGFEVELAAGLPAVVPFAPEVVLGIL